MPMPSRVRNRSRNQKVGENPAMKLQIENHAIEIISGFLRPIRSAIQPAAVAPTRRIHKVKVKTIATSVGSFHQGTLLRVSTADIIPPPLTTAPRLEALRLS